MREIRFRGKLSSDNDWAVSPYQGGVIHGGVLFEDFIPETVGQYTGHHDMNGVEIWEDDIVRLYDSNNDGEDPPYCVVWDDVAAGFAFTSDEFTATFDNFFDFQIEVIGNTWDNPKLMEVTNDVQ